MKFLLVAFTLGAPMAAMPAAPVAAAAPVPANDLDRLIAQILPERQLLALMFTSVRKDFARVPDFARDPALADFVLARLRPDLEKVMRDELPSLRTELRGIIAGDMTAAEIGDVYTFFASPTGQKLQAHLYKALADNPQASQPEQQRIAMAAFMADLQPADYPALTAFGTSAGAQKMNQVSPRIAAASSGWADRLIARHGPRFGALRSQAIADYKRQKGTGQ